MAMWLGAMLCIQSDFENSAEWLTTHLESSKIINKKGKYNSALQLADKGFRVKYYMLFSIFPKLFLRDMRLDHII